MIDSPIFAERKFGKISVVVTNRAGGSSSAQFSSFNLADHVGDDPRSVAENRRVLANLLQVDSVKVLDANHGCDVQIVNYDSVVMPGDGMVTKSVNLGLVALAADCVPFALVDPIAQIVAVGHCGWKGLVTGLPKALAQSFIEQGGDSARATAVLGPAICSQCYEVDGNRVHQLAEICPRSVADENHLDIRAGVAEQLGGFGFVIEHIFACTLESPDLYSYRRDGITGRHALAVVINQGKNEL